MVDIVSLRKWFYKTYTCCWSSTKCRPTGRLYWKILSSIRHQTEKKF